MPEQEWYEKHKKDVAAALKKGKTAAIDAAVACTLVKMVDGTFLLCAHINAGKAAALVKEARHAGGKVVSAGRLYLGDEGVVFELDTGDLTVKPKVALASAAVGVPLNVTVQQAEGAVPPPPGSEATAAVQAALTKLVPAIQQAVKDHPQRKNDLLQPLARCKQQIEENKAVEAKATLLEIGRLVKELTGHADVSETPESETETGTEPDEYQELYHGLLETVPGDLQRLRKTDPATAEKIQTVVDGAAGHAKKGEFQQAFTLLNRAADILAKAVGSARVEEAGELVPEGKVAAMKAALTQAQSKWDAAVTAARTRLKPVQAALQTDFPSAAAGVNDILDGYEEELLGELRAGQAKADEDGLAGAVHDTLAKVQALRAAVDDDDVFSYLEECGVPVKVAFAEAFDEVVSLLQV